MRLYNNNKKDAGLTEFQRLPSGSMCIYIHKRNTSFTCNLWLYEKKIRTQEA